MTLFELHPAEHAALRAAMAGDGAAIHRRDGFEGLLALAPLAPRRGLALVDPSYEVKSDYAAVAAFARRLVAKWPEAVVAIWYPLLPAGRSRELLAGLADLPHPARRGGVSRRAGPRHDRIGHRARQPAVRRGRGLRRGARPGGGGPDAVAPRSGAMSRLARWMARRWLALTLALVAAITALSLTALPGGDGGVVARTDKLQHLIAYGALAFPIAVGRPRGWIAILAGLALWSGAIELIQPLVGRKMHRVDLAANVVGLAFGVAAAWGLRRVVRAASVRPMASAFVRAASGAFSHRRTMPDTPSNAPGASARASRRSGLVGGGNSSARPPFRGESRSGDNRARRRRGSRAVQSARGGAIRLSPISSAPSPSPCRVGCTATGPSSSAGMPAASRPARASTGSRPTSAS